MWTPPAARKRRSNMAAFVEFVNARRGRLRRCNLALPQEYAPLHDWSVRCADEFWNDVWDFFGIVGDKGARLTEKLSRPPGMRFFPDGRLNFAENLLKNADNRPALIAWDELGRRTLTTRAELRADAMRLAGFLRANGVGAGDCVGAVMPNGAETVVALLASASLGAVFSSCSSDFGVEEVISRLGQIRPKALIFAAEYRYGGRVFDRRAALAEIAARLPSLCAVVVTGIEDAPPAAVNISTWREATAHAPCEEFVRMPFCAPLAVLYSSGTTGAPKCIVHGSGGTLLQHLKELSLHTDVRGGDKVFYFTTCGWMMWNWLVSALALEATILLYDGNPMMTPEILWDMAEAEEVAVFGASAKYFDAQRKAQCAPKKTRQLPALRTICSTGSPLSAEGFAYVYAAVKSDVHLASISGGTDIVSCFVLGNPFDAVRAGEIQCAGLGMAVEVFDDDGAPIVGRAGELVCTAAAPCMPLGFWNDDGGGKYRAAYFERFPGVWTHGDRTTQRDNGAFVIHGRSDATLNPGGVRIGTAEIYRHVEALDEVAEALAVGQRQDGDERVVLFLRLRDGAALDEDLRQRIRAALREKASPRHVPAKIIAVADLPRTRSGKISEIAAREMIHNRPVKNAAALANPQSLEYFRNLPELQDGAV